MLVMQARPFGAPGDEGFQFFRAHYGAQTMGSGVIVIVDQHSGADQIFSRGSDTADARVLMAGFRAQSFFGGAHAFAPHMTGIAEFDFVLADIEVGSASAPRRSRLFRHSRRP